jgi:hypothetical protein
MLRTLIVASACIAVSAQIPAVGTCVLNGGQAISDAADAGVYAWAASQRCGKGSGNDIKCMTDIMSAVESTNMMVNVILEIVDQCSEVKDTVPDVALAASRLTAAFTGIGAASAQVIRQCRDNSIAKANGYVSDDTLLANSQAASVGPPATAEVKAGDFLWQGGRSAECAIDIKNSMAQVMKATTAIASAKQYCGVDGQANKCAYNTLGIVAAFSGMARFVQESVGKCSTSGTKFLNDYPMHCAAAISRVFQATTRFTGAAVELASAVEYQPTTTAAPVQGTPAPKNVVVQPTYGSHQGQPFQVGVGAIPQTRLYAQQIIDTARIARSNGDSKEPEKFPALNVGLAASLPITAIAAFVGGMKLRRVSSPTEYSSVATIA